MSWFIREEHWQEELDSYCLQLWNLLSFSWIQEPFYLTPLALVCPHF